MQPFEKLFNDTSLNIQHVIDQNISALRANSSQLIALIDEQTEENIITLLVIGCIAKQLNKPEVVELALQKCSKHFSKNYEEDNVRVTHEELNLWLAQKVEERSTKGQNQIKEIQIRQATLPVLQPKGDQSDVDAVAEVIKSGWWGKGPKVDQLEKEFARLVGAKYAVAVTSNSHGQDLIMKALGIKNRDVVNPTISFMATAMIPLWNDCTTNVVDVDPYSMNIDPADVRKHLTPKSDVLIAVNQAGVPAPIDDIRKFYGGFIIEDCAHSCYTPGAGLKGDAAVWSFQAVKTMPSGDGGMITLNDEKLYNKLKEMTWFGVSSTFSRVNKNDGVTGKPGYTWDYEVDKVGYKCYMIDLTAALCLSQLKKLPAMLEWRRHIQARYNAELCEAVTRPPISNTVQHYCAKVPSEQRCDLMDYLADKKIHTSVHYKPLHTYEVIQKHLTHKGRSYNVADQEWLKLLSLPVHNAMSEDDIDYVIFWVNKYFREKNTKL